MSPMPGIDAWEAECRDFVAREVEPFAAEHDRDRRMRAEVLRAIGARGFFGATVPREWGGLGLDWTRFGILCEAIGAACRSVASVLTAHTMVTHTLQRWGSADLRRRWLPVLASGQSLGAFALTEPECGSDAAAVRTEAVAVDDTLELTGRKRWISGGQIADLFLVFVRRDGAPYAVLVERDRHGLSIAPSEELIGFRGAGLADLTFDRCAVPRTSGIGPAGGGVSHVASYALAVGRYIIAWTSVGLARACLDAVASYTAGRTQFGVPLKDHQLIREMVTDMVVGHDAARLLCLRAGALLDERDPDALVQANIAKYAAARAAAHAARSAVQMHGAVGCTEALPVSRHLRDVAILEIIEGSTQILQLQIAERAYQQAAARAASRATASPSTPTADRTRPVTSDV
jgi:alkylation response protein AidB-like acyl-CoA dehydrogenase